MDELRFSNVIVNVHLSTGVVCIQGAGFLEFANKSFSVLKASLDGKQKRSDISSFNDLLRVNRWYVKKQSGDGHCLIHSISATTSIEESFIIRDIHTEAKYSSQCHKTHAHSSSLHSALVFSQLASESPVDSPLRM